VQLALTCTLSVHLPQPQQGHRPSGTLPPAANSPGVGMSLMLSYARLLYSGSCLRCSRAASGLMILRCAKAITISCDLQALGFEGCQGAQFPSPPHTQALSRAGAARFMWMRKQKVRHTASPDKNRVIRTCPAEHTEHATCYKIMEESTQGGSPTACSALVATRRACSTLSSMRHAQQRRQHAAPSAAPQHAEPPTPQHAAHKAP